jgi:hypothetical protein
MKLLTKKGLRTFEFNTETGELSEAEYSRGSIFMSSSPDNSTTSETFYCEPKPNCKYFYALNMKNAKRKISTKP